jgi:branched-chain amino acid transport system permease protein
MSSQVDRKWVWIGGIVLAVGLLILPFLFKNYRVFQFNLVLVYAVAILGLNILTGFNGQFSLGHGAFYAFGAYTAAILMTNFGVPYWATLPVAFVFCFVFGFLVGFPALRLAGHFLALATFALALAVPQLLKYKKIEGLTGGVQGIVLSKPEPPFSFTLFDQPLSADRWLYFFTLFVTALMFLFAWNLLRGRVGRALVAIRDHPIAATAMGINLPVFKSLTFGTSAGFTGLAGALGRGLRVAGQLYRHLVDLPAGRRGGGRAGFDSGRDLWRHLHPVCAEHRRRDLEVGAGRHLRRAADRPDVPDADRRDGWAAAPVGEAARSSGGLSMPLAAHFIDAFL